MAKRLLPYRNINPYNEVSRYALADAYVNNSTSGTGFGDEGVFVKVLSGNLDLDPISFSSDAYLGKTNYNAVGWNQRPSVSLKVAPAASGDQVLGITLRETALYDENGQYLTRYHQKVVEQAVCLKGESVPIATRGEIMFGPGCVDGTLSIPGGFKLSTTSGKITGCLATDSAKIGQVLASGSRGTRGTYVDAYSGIYYLGLLG